MTVMSYSAAQSCFCLHLFINSNRFYCQIFRVSDVNVTQHFLVMFQIKSHILKPGYGIHSDLLVTWQIGEMYIRKTESPGWRWNSRKHLVNKAWSTGEELCNTFSFWWTCTDARTGSEIDYRLFIIRLLSHWKAFKVKDVLSFIEGDSIVLRKTAKREATRNS